MSNKNSCYTYFEITGNFDPAKVTEMLGLTPSRVRNIGDKLTGGRVSDRAVWEFGRCDKYNVEVEQQMRCTIAPLLDKVEILNQIRAEYDVKFWLSVVPSVFVGESTPALAPTLDIIDFCHETRTEIDIDLYVYD